MIMVIFQQFEKMLFLSSASCAPHCFMEQFQLFGPLIYEAAIC